MLLMKKNFPSSQSSLNSPGKLLFVNRVQSEAKYVSSHRNQNTTAITPSSSRTYVARSSLSISEKREPVGPNCSGGTSCVPVPRDGQDPDTNIKLSPSNTEICVNSNLSEILSLNQLLQHYLCLWPPEFLKKNISNIFSKNVSIDFGQNWLPGAAKGCK